MKPQLPQSARGLFAFAIGLALLSLWGGARVITMLPEHTIALHLAALLSILLGRVCAGVMAMHAMDVLSQERRAARR